VTTGNSARVGLSVPISSSVTARLNGNISVQSGSAMEELALPATDRTQRGVDVSISGLIDAFTLTPSATWQDVRDQVTPYYDQSIVAVGLTGSGPVGGRVLASASIHGTRIEADPLVGRTDQWLISVQPTLALDELWLSVAPRVSVSRTANTLQDTDQTATHYGVAARWAPPWVGSIAAVELASDWTRDRSEFDPVAPFVRRTLLTIGLNWRGDRRWAPGRQ
jgi:hypothetical protein